MWHPNTVTLWFSILTTMISDADAEVSSCSERHNSVLLMSLRWQPYSRLRTKGSDSDSDSRLTSIRVSNVWPETLLDNRTWWVTWKKRKEIFYSHVGRIPKGQLFSKCPYEIIVSSKIPTKLLLDFCPEIFCTFLGASWKLFRASCRLPCLWYYIPSPQEATKKLRAEIQ